MWFRFTEALAVEQVRGGPGVVVLSKSKLSSAIFTANRSKVPAKLGWQIYPGLLGIGIREVLLMPPVSPATRGLWALGQFDVWIAQSCFAQGLTILNGDVGLPFGDLKLSADCR